MLRGVIAIVVVRRVARGDADDADTIRAKPTVTQFVPTLTSHCGGMGG